MEKRDLLTGNLNHWERMESYANTENAKKGFRDLAASAKEKLKLHIDNKPEGAD